MTILGTGTAAFYERARLGMTGLRAQAEAIQSQLDTGKRLSRSSDDPVAASRLRRLDREQRLSTIDEVNAARATSNLELADSALSDIADAVIRAKVLAGQAASGTLSPDQRASIGTELGEIGESLLALANARDSTGKALFGGAATGDAYQRDATGAIAYLGTATAGTISLGNGQSVTRSLTGPEVLQVDAAAGPTDLISLIGTLAQALGGGDPDPAGAARTAMGDLDLALDKVTTGQTVVGSRLAWIELAGDRRTEAGELRAGEQTDLGDTDLASSIARLQQTMLVLEASQTSFGKLAGLTLFDQLR